MPLPKPPINNMTDFVVFCFVSIVTLTLISTAVALIVLTFINPDRDTNQIVGILADVMTTLIGALVGFIAGKGSGKAEAHEEQAEERRQERVSHDTS